MPAAAKRPNIGARGPAGKNPLATNNEASKSQLGKNPKPRSMSGAARAGGMTAAGRALGVTLNGAKEIKDREAKVFCEILRFLLLMRER